MSNQIALDAESPFLSVDPPHWAARGLSTLLLVLFVVATIAAIVVQIPETVSGSFVLVPEHGADPLRVPREGTIAEVRTSEGTEVARGATLFVIRSQPVGDRASELRTLGVQVSGAEGRLLNAKSEYESEVRASNLEKQRLERRLASLARVASR
jgi:multidrug efflux pump subunit AcrA (membrane-fusion protein)